MATWSDVWAAALEQVTLNVGRLVAVAVPAIGTPGWR
jgi:hypothetical protein